MQAAESLPDRDLRYRHTDHRTQGAIIARLERLNRSSLQLRARLLVGLATFFDGFDALLIAATLPVLIREWALSPAQAGLLIASSAAGALIGTLVFPQIADRYGRVRAVTISTFIIGAGSIACGLTENYVVFLVIRFIQGIGIGGELPVAATYINEIARAHGRGRFVLLYEVIYPIGLLVSTIVGAWMVPRLGWESLYFVGGIPMVLALLMPRLVPESPRWLAGKGRMQASHEAMQRFEASARAPLPMPEDGARYDEMIARTPVRRVRDVFGPLYLRRTLVIALLWASCGFIQSSLTTWLPTIYQVIYKVPLQMALNLAIGASALGVVGSIVCAFLVDRVGRKPVIVWAFLGCAVALAAAGLMVDMGVYVVAALSSLAFGLLACGFITVFVYTPEMYPTSVRALGCGVGGVWAKLAAISGPMVMTQFVGSGHLDLAFFCLGVVTLITALAVARYGIETRGKVLEELEV
ncbi:MFS transporter [Bordetella trematum]|uniref:MFS transporter n=1 Tax=Bordetella trematum TaxID=123899 RepID=UPI0015593F94|nr:MFS transporter [Bordetella trematum]